MEEERNEKTNLRIAQDSLSAIHKATEISDGKAASLLTALGVVFGLSVFSIEGLRTKEGVQFMFICVFGIVYLASFLVSMALLVLVVFPRKKSRSAQKKVLCSFYSEDVYFANKQGKLEDLLSKEPGMSEIMDQVKICVKISHLKQVLLRISTISLLCFSLSLVALVVLAFI